MGSAMKKFFYEQSYQQPFSNHKMLFIREHEEKWRVSDFKGQFCSILNVYFNFGKGNLYVPRLGRSILRRGGAVLT